MIAFPEKLWKLFLRELWKHFVWKGEEQNPSPGEEQADEQLLPRQADVTSSTARMCPLAELAPPFAFVSLDFFLQSCPNTERFHLWKENQEHTPAPSTSGFVFELLSSPWEPSWILSAVQQPPMEADEAASTSLPHSAEDNTSMSKCFRVLKFAFLIFFKYIVRIIIIPEKSATSENKIWFNERTHFLQK